MLKSLLAAFAIPELRQRIQFVFIMFGVFMVGLHIPVPGIDRAQLERLVNSQGLLTLFDTFSGGAFRKFTIFAMGITPYINASIIMQLLTVAMPQLEELAKEGEGGRKQIAKYTRRLTVLLSIVQSIGLLAMLGGFHPGGGGLHIIEARDLNHVIQLMSQHPGMKYGLLEIRPVADVNEMMKESEQRRRKDTSQ